MRGQRQPTRLPRRALLGALAALAAPAPLRASHPAAPALGVILPAGEAGALARAGAEIAAEMLARRGRPLPLRFATAEGGAEPPARAVSRLVDEGAALLLATGGDAATEAALAAAERREVPLIAATAISPGLGDRGSRLLIRTGPTASQLVGRGLGLLRDLYAAASLPLPGRLALVHADTAEGRVVRASLAAILPAAGLALTGHAEIGLGAGDPGQGNPGGTQHGREDAGHDAHLAARLREAAPDLVLFAGPPAAVGGVVAAIGASGVSVAGLASFGVGGLAAQEVIALPGKAGDCHVTFSPWPDPASAITAEARMLYERRPPAPAETMPFSLVQGGLGLVVDAALLAGEGLARHPAARGQALAAALRGSVLMQKMMRGPPMRFDARGQNTAMPSVALQNQGDRPVVVLPRESAEASPIWPNPGLIKS
jgi:branched-chain amino acid transport system substrate-binding protein